MKKLEIISNKKTKFAWPQSYLNAALNVIGIGPH